jgi:hypothetical protein
MSEQIDFLLSKINGFFRKLNFQSVVSVVAIAALLISNSYFVVQAQEAEPVSNAIQEETTVSSDDQAQSSTDQPEQLESETEGSITAESTAFVPGADALPHPSCVAFLSYIDQTSNVYVPNSDYDLVFVSTAAPYSSFQDVNGDGLLDYIYAKNETNFSGGVNLSSEYIACLYLHNGSGWTKEYMCRAYTILDTQTGQFTRKEYTGDCAG